MEWKLIYKDKNGIEKAVIQNDGKTLSTKLRGITFRGNSFDSLKPDEKYKLSQLNKFSFSHGELYNCIIECYINITIFDNEQITDGQLKVVLELGNENQNGLFDIYNLVITLIYNGITIESSMSEMFEDALLDIQKKLPAGIYMKTCINCAYSDYSPFGSCLFGTMMCFRNLKQEYLRVKSKEAFLKIHDNFEKLVQETYCCDEFSRRISGTGYRG